QASRAGRGDRRKVRQGVGNRGQAAPPPGGAPGAASRTAVSGSVAGDRGGMQPEPAEQPFKNHFSDRAAAYAARRPTYPPALAEFLAEVAPRRELAWDSGCGSGQLSVLLAGRFEQVIATDASAEQIAQARPHPKVRYAQAPAEASGLPAAVVDLAVAAQAAHWFDLAGYY